MGGAYPAVGDRNLDESHDPKGIKISRGRIMQPDAEVLLKWNKVEKRIGELIDAGRYLSQKEIEHYPVYHAQEEARKARWAISNEFRSIVRDYNDFVEQLGEEDKKRNAYPTAITQNVEYLLDSVQASTMLSNSEFVIMLNQAASDREKLAQLLNISNEQMSYITNADAGCGLIKYGSALVPFINQFPRDTKLYQLMTTRPGEGEFARGQD